jgi:hypothetical protein
MGRQYGHLLSDELHEIYDLSVKEHLIKEKGIPEAEIHAHYLEGFGAC